MLMVLAIHCFQTNKVIKLTATYNNIKFVRNLFAQIIWRFHDKHKGLVLGYYLIQNASDLTRKYYSDPRCLKQAQKIRDPHKFGKLFGIINLKKKFQHLFYL